MKWITRERVKVDRVACPWLLRKALDCGPWRRVSMQWVCPMKSACSGSFPSTTPSMSTPARHYDGAVVEGQTTIGSGDPCFSDSPTNPMAVVLWHFVSHRHAGKCPSRG